MVLQSFRRVLKVPSKNTSEHERPNPRLPNLPRADEPEGGLRQNKRPPHLAPLPHHHRDCSGQRHNTSAASKSGALETPPVPCAGAPAGPWALGCRAGSRRPAAPGPPAGPGGGLIRPSARAPAGGQQPAGAAPPAPGPPAAPRPCTPTARP